LNPLIIFKYTYIYTFANVKAIFYGAQKLKALRPDSGQRLPPNKR
jgi:hypothetical protein